MATMMQESPQTDAESRAVELVEMETGTLLKAALVYITPTIALAWLKRNVNFRKIMPSVVARYADEMTKRRWDVNAETIKFYENGDLKDGQHRLEACVVSGVPFLSLVVWGIQSDLKVDIGPNRSLKDILDSRGEASAKNLAATLRWLWRWDNDLLITTGKKALAANDELLATLERRPDVRKSVERIAGHKARLLPNAMIGFLHYAFSRADGEAADKFFDVLETGENLPSHNPVFILRKRLDEQRRKKTRLPQIEKLAITIIAWHYWLQGKPATPSAIRWRASGKNPQPFPSISLDSTSDDE